MGVEEGNRLQAEQVPGAGDSHQPEAQWEAGSKSLPGSTHRLGHRSSPVHKPQALSQLQKPSKVLQMSAFFR